MKTIDRRFAFLREQAGLPAELTLHCLRHSYVTHLVEFGYPERFVTEQVGHSYACRRVVLKRSFRSIPGGCGERRRARGNR